MDLGLSGAPYPGALPYAAAINSAAYERDFWPCVLGAIAWQETIGSELSGWLVETYGDGTTAANCISGDGGHGLCQLTYSFPLDWVDPRANLIYAIDAFLSTAVQYWSVHEKMAGEDLLRCLAAEFNAGRAGALAGHNAGDVGKNTTHDEDGVSYTDNVLRIYRRLILGEKP